MYICTYDLGFTYYQLAGFLFRLRRSRDGWASKFAIIASDPRPLSPGPVLVCTISITGQLEKSGTQSPMACRLLEKAGFSPYLSIVIV